MESKRLMHAVGERGPRPAVYTNRRNLSITDANGNDVDTPEAPLDTLPLSVQHLAQTSGTVDIVWAIRSTRK